MIRKHPDEIYVRKTAINESTLGATGYFDVIGALLGDGITRIAVYKFDRYIDIQKTVSIKELK